MSKRDKILMWGVAMPLTAVLVFLTIVTYAAVSSKSSVVSAAPTDPARWIQTDRVFLSEREQNFYYTCSGNGRQEGTVQPTAEGLWFASSEHGDDHWNHIDAKFRTKEQAQRAIEEFVAQYNLCK